MLFYLDDLPVLFPYERLVAPHSPSFLADPASASQYIPRYAVLLRKRRKVLISRAEQYQYMADLKKTLDAGVCPALMVLRTS